jgi:hypothetical protein
MSKRHDSYMRGRGAEFLSLPRNGRHAKSAWTKEREPKLWEHQRGHGWSRKGRRTHTPCGRAGGGPRIAAVPFDLPFGAAGDPRKSDGKAAHSEQPGPDVSTTLRHGESPKDPTGRDLLTASSPAPTCRQHCDTERVRKIQWEGMCSQRAARAPSESSVRLAVRVDNIATRPGGSTVQVLTDYVCYAARYIRGCGKGACQRVLHSDLT